MVGIQISPISLVGASLGLPVGAAITMILTPERLARAATAMVALTLSALPALS